MFRLTGRLEHSRGGVLLMRRVSSRRKPKSTSVNKRAGTKAQKPTVVSMARRGPVGRFYVVGLGASAGGLEALRSFFAAVPAKSGAAFVVIQHLAPAHRSQMVELLATHTTVPVSQIEDGVMIQPDHVYVIPPGKWVKIFRGRLFLVTRKNARRFCRYDYFFRSLAEDRGELAIGIALSGTGSDGTLGVRAIKEAGGTVMVQDEGSARFSGMPGSAGATGLADYVLPPAADGARTIAIHPASARRADEGRSAQGRRDHDAEDRQPYSRTDRHRLHQLQGEYSGAPHPAAHRYRAAGQSRRLLWNFLSNRRRKSRCSGATC